jgi:predicted transcriptional regulator of viral defense system
MTYRRRLPALHKLHRTAHAQGGYVTAKQAAAAGFGPTHLNHHVRAGNLERVQRGLYRVPTIPRSEDDELIRLSLWSRNRRDEPQAVISHASALVRHGITDLLPSRIDLSVPKRFYRTPPPGCVLHRRSLERSDVEQHAGYAVTKPFRTLLDSADASDVPYGELANATERALERGLVRKQELAIAARREHRTRLVRALQEAKALR